MNTLAVTVLGHDRPGIIATATSALADLGGNLEDSSMTLLRGHFAMTLVVSGEATPDHARAALVSAFAETDLVVTVIELTRGAAPAPTGPSYVLSVHGGDRPGIVSAVAGLVAAHGGNVTDLTTRLAGALYVVVAEVELPADADLAALTDALAALAGELGVEASLRPADSDLL
jgi:glycine cleavage system transcriptional repressor